MGDPTDELRARLDELGIEWWDIETNDKSQTLTECIIDDVRCKYRKVGRGLIVSTCTEGTVTSEQAIAATVGAGTCEPWDMRSNHAVQAANEQKVDERNTVPETKYLMALDEAREAQRKLEMCQTSQKVYQSKCRSFKETNADLRRIIDDMKAARMGTCTIKPDGYHGEEYGIYKCSNCGKLWLFGRDGPKGHGWKYCPHCRAEIKED